MRRALRCLLLAWLALWFGVIAPGHERGVVLLPGTGGGAGCCALRGELTVNRGQNQPQRAPAQPAKHCAICKLNATLSTPPAVHFDLPELGLIALLPLPPPASAPQLDLTHLHFGRGPPTLI